MNAKTCDDTIGIVAEYNPLHNGHRFMLESAKAKLPHAACVVVLGSNFTQRGIPALVDKWTRTRMALACGADLVLELPFLFACAAAQDFSAGAVDILARTHLVTHIAFGMENPQREFAPLLDILIHEPLSFKQAIKKELDRGASYPKAVAIALNQSLCESGINSGTSGEGSFLSSPNDLLALSYMLRVQSRGYSLKALPIARVGSEHNELDIGNTGYASAGAIREMLARTVNLEQANLEQALSHTMPDFSRALLLEANSEGRLCLQDAKLWPLVQALFLRSTSDDLKIIDGMDEGLENLFLKHWKDAENLGDFVGRCVSARNTAGRIRRRIMRALLGVKRDIARATVQAGVPFARVLGFNARGRALLRKHVKNSEIPIITRLADAMSCKQDSKNSMAKFIATLEFKASALYEMLLDNPQMHREERMRPIS